MKSGNYKILYLLGSCYQRLGKLDMAKQLFEYSLINETSYTKARFALANVLYAQQNYNKSKEYLFEIIQIESSYITACSLFCQVGINCQYHIRNIELIYFTRN